jgi:alkanesulfonate monooxygenase SsuD/methylene tetrahydromethanopterin reductase-like flavin-dependent oxidoreductase (luciferase family)
MRIGITLLPSGDWDATLAAARAAEAAGLDAIGVWDHFHSNNPDEALIGGWSLYGALAMATSRIRLVPMVLNQLSYPINVLARESSTLAIMSGGRFELGIGLGGWKGEHTLWGLPFPNAATRTAMLEEKIQALRALWRGGPATMTGDHVTLDGATMRPVPAVAPRVVVGCGSYSRRLIADAAGYADELHLGNQREETAALARFARERIDASGREVTLSSSLVLDTLPPDLPARLAWFENAGFSRVFIELARPYALIPEIGAAMGTDGTVARA